MQLVGLRDKGVVKMRSKIHPFKTNLSSMQAVSRRYNCVGAG